MKIGLIDFALWLQGHLIYGKPYLIFVNLFKRIISVKTTNSESKMIHERSSKPNTCCGVSMVTFLFIDCKERSQTCVGSCCWLSSQHFLPVEKKNINFSEVTGNQKVNIKSFKNFHYKLLFRSSVKTQSLQQNTGRLCVVVDHTIMVKRK